MVFWLVQVLAMTGKSCRRSVDLFLLTVLRIFEQAGAIDVRVHLLRILFKLQRAVRLSVVGRIATRESVLCERPQIALLDKVLDEHFPELGVVVPPKLLSVHLDKAAILL